MKKVFCAVTALAMALSLLLSACGSPADVKESEVSLRHISFGSGEKTMVVVPGLSTGYVTDNAEAIEGAFSAFTQDYTVYLFDVRDDVPADYTIRRMGEDLAVTMQKLGLKDTYMYGCSMGGMQCIYVAAEHPDLVSKVVIASAACKANETSDSVIGNWIRLAKEEKCQELTADMGQRIYSQAVYEANKDAFSAMADGLTKELLQRFINTASVIPGLDLTPEAAAVRCPVLVLGAAGDRVLTGAASAQIAEIAGGELYLYGEEYPHAVYDEAPDFRDRVKAFFDGEAAAEQTCEVTCTVTQDTKYNAAVTSLSQEEFEAAGFRLGDSCDVIFSNGYELTDIPYYNGYYVKTGEPIIVAYPGFASVYITHNIAGIWDTAGLSEGDTVTIRCKTAGKYSAVQDALGQLYSFERADYGSDVAFCNFRALTGGKLKENFLFRGASPVDNSRGRAPYTDALLAQSGIQTVIDLADTGEDMAGYRAREDFASDYTASLCDAGKVSLLGMSPSYQSPDYQQRLVSGLRQMMKSEGPVYIHCMEGKDRTGFVCMLLEALAGASYAEMRADYMLTYRNYYSIDPEQTPEKYDAITQLYFDAFMSYLLGTDAVELLWDSDYSGEAAAYLMEGGMTEAEVARLREYITQ